ncbi:MAG: aldehyde dehydrogenase family protein, partial [Solirubrobacterales bacterium]
MNPETVEKTSRHFIGGTWTEPASDETIEVINATTEETMGSVPAGTAADVDAAVAAAN